MKRKSQDTNLRSAIYDMANALKDTFKRHTRATRKKAWKKLSGSDGQRQMNKILDDPNRSLNMFAQLAFKEWLQLEAYRYWDGKVGEYKQANVLIFWTDTGSKPKMQGKVGGFNWDQFIKNADAGHGTAFFIEAPNKASALELLPQVQQCPNHNNVFYYGPGAAHALGIS